MIFAAFVASMYLSFSVILGTKVYFMERADGGTRLEATLIAMVSFVAWPALLWKGQQS